MASQVSFPNQFVIPGVLSVHTNNNLTADKVMTAGIGLFSTKEVTSEEAPTLVKAILEDPNLSQTVVGQLFAHILGTPAVYTQTKVATQPQRIKAGDSFPNVRLSMQMIGDTGPSQVEFSTHSVLRGKKTVLFTLPSPFTPVCHKTHFPGFAKLAEKFNEEGYQLVCCTPCTVDIARTWLETFNHPNIFMFPDPESTLLYQLGSLLDRSGPRGVGLAGARTVLVIGPDLVVQKTWHEEGDDAGLCDKTSAAYVYSEIKNGFSS